MLTINQMVKFFTLAKELSDDQEINIAEICIGKILSKNTMDLIPKFWLIGPQMKMLLNMKNF